MTTTTKSKLLSLALLCSTAWSLTLPALAQDNGPRRMRQVDWARLNLSADQDQRINRLQSDWSGKYTQVMPQIHHQQQHLHELFKNPQADPLEIVSTQQSVMRLQEQLRNEATSNYLRKRAILNDGQQKMLEAQMHQMVVDRQQRQGSGLQPAQDDNGGIMNIMQKVRWAIEPR